MNPGILLGLGAYLAWGLFPLYYRLLAGVPALELVAHRVVWSFAVLAAGVVATGRARGFLARTRDARIWSFHAATGLLVAANWLLYVWGVNAGKVVECSLGYFLNPLVNIALGVAFLRERLRPGQWAGVALAGSGVLLLAARTGSFPWLALSLAASFGVYGLLKKRAPLGSVDGLLAETTALLPAAALLVALAEAHPDAPLRGASAATWALVVGTGVVTTVPLLLFGAAARRIPLSTLGFVQYLTPSMQFLIGVLWFREPFGPDRIGGFALVWAGLGCVVADGIRHKLARRGT